MMLFCGRLAEFSGPLSTPNVTFRYLSGTQPSWARGADLDEELDYTYFEIYVIYDTPILSLPSDLISVEAGTPTTMKLKLWILRKRKTQMSIHLTFSKV